MSSTPKLLDSVLAQIEAQNDLGKSTWYEVVYHNEDGWQSYQGSDTFDTLSYTVLDWTYCEDCFEQVN